MAFHSSRKCIGVTMSLSSHILQKHVGMPYSLKDKKRVGNSKYLHLVASWGSLMYPLRHSHLKPPSLLMQSCEQVPGMVHSSISKMTETKKSLGHRVEDRLKKISAYCRGFLFQNDFGLFFRGIITISDSLVYLETISGQEQGQSHLYFRK